jgi:hypothetical protein
MKGAGEPGDRWLHRVEGGLTPGGYAVWREESPDTVMKHAFVSAGAELITGQRA